MEWIYKNDFIKMDIYHSSLKIKKSKNSPALNYLFNTSNGNTRTIFFHNWKFLVSFILNVVNLEVTTFAEYFSKLIIKIPWKHDRPFLVC